MLIGKDLILKTASAEYNIIIVMEALTTDKQIYMK